MDDVAGYNIHTIAIQMPITQLTRDQELPTGDDQGAIGIYASASRQKTTRAARRRHEPGRQGHWVQVSRLGNPLINEVDHPARARRTSGTGTTRRDD